MSAAKTRKPRSKSKKAPSGIHCCDCNKLIPAKQQALFVEEEVNRYFCQESCIVSFFTSEIEKLEREYGRHVSPTDLSSEERDGFSHLRWTTLENPDEIWREAMATGDNRYTMIAQYKNEKKPVWGVCVCLMLRGEPSFLFIAFVTNDRHLVDVFRKGEKMKVVRKKGGAEELRNVEAQKPTEQESEGQNVLAEPWSESDSVRATIIRHRKKDDIPVEDFGFYQKCLEETLQEPTELWSYSAKKVKRVYHFIREYEHDKNYWYIVIAKDTPDDTQIEIVDAFPTKDKTLMELCRHGKKEVIGEVQQAEESEDQQKRTVH